MLVSAHTKVQLQRNRAYLMYHELQLHFEFLVCGKVRLNLQSSSNNFKHDFKHGHEIVILSVVDVLIFDGTSNF